MLSQHAIDVPAKSARIPFKVTCDDSGYLVFEGWAQAPDAATVLIGLENVQSTVSVESMRWSEAATCWYFYVTPAADAREFCQRVRIPDLAGQTAHCFVQHWNGDADVSLYLKGIDFEKGSVFIYGSCVSRDPFELPGSLKLDGYYARSSLVSAFSLLESGLADADLSTNPSPFQRRMVAADLTRQIPELLRTSTADVILIDLVDERFDLAVGGLWGPITLTPELETAEVDLAGRTRIPSAGEDYFSAFRVAWKRLVEIVAPERIVVNRVKWATHDSLGKSCLVLRQFMPIMTSWSDSIASFRRSHPRLPG